MTTLLHIEVSPMGENSISRAVTAEFLDAWKASHPDGTVIERDLAANPVPVLDGEAIFAFPHHSRPTSTRSSSPVYSTAAAPRVWPARRSRWSWRRAARTSRELRARAGTSDLATSTSSLRRSAQPTWK